ncbi:MAG: hypothetical protein NTY77_11845 [Elusimicrobia bacterium]|nr:hypothetical protein [Elusimicrobiota bacterium]
MKKARLFGELLARTRREQGFPTAHAFYRSRDGRRAFRLSFRNYLNLETGLSLPKAERLEALLLALDLNEQAPRGRELVQAYFAALGMDALLRYAAAAQPAAPDLPSLKLRELAVRTALQHNAFQLSLEQWRALAANAANYSCYLLVMTTPEWWPVKLVARRTGLSMPVARRAVKALAAAGVFKLEGDRVRSATGPEKVIQPLPLTPATAGLKASLQRRFQDIVETKGRIVFRRMVKFRTPKPNLDQYLPHLDDAISLAAVFEDLESKEGNLYLMESRLWSLFAEG